MAMAVKHSRTISLSAERVTAMMACGVAKKAIYIISCNRTSKRSRYKMSCVTVFLREHTMLLFLAIQSTTVIELISLEFIKFNRNSIRLPRETFSISKAKTLKPYAMNRCEKTIVCSIFIVLFVYLLTFKVFNHSYFIFSLL